MTTAVTAVVCLPFAAAADALVESRIYAALSREDIAMWQALHNDVRPVDAARRITGGRAGARIFID